MLLLEDERFAPDASFSGLRWPIMAAVVCTTANSTAIVGWLPGTLCTTANSMAIVVSVITTSTRVVDLHPTWGSSCSSSSHGGLPKFAGEIVVNVSYHRRVTSLVVAASPLWGEAARMDEVVE